MGANVDIERLERAAQRRLDGQRYPQQGRLDQRLSGERIGRAIGQFHRAADRSEVGGERKRIDAPVCAVVVQRSLQCAQRHRIVLTSCAKDQFVDRHVWQINAHRQMQGRGQGRGRISRRGDHLDAAGADRIELDARLQQGQRCKRPSRVIDDQLQVLIAPGDSGGLQFAQQRSTGRFDRQRAAGRPLGLLDAPFKQAARAVRPGHPGKRTDHHEQQRQQDQSDQPSQATRPAAADGRARVGGAGGLDRIGRGDW